jgi:hypothetical protein
MGALVRVVDGAFIINANMLIQLKNLVTTPSTVPASHVFPGLRR